MKEQTQLRIFGTIFPILAAFGVIYGPQEPLNSVFMGFFAGGGAILWIFSFDAK